MVNACSVYHSSICFNIGDIVFLNKQVTVAKLNHSLNKRSPKIFVVNRVNNGLNQKTPSLFDRKAGYSCIDSVAIVFLRSFASPVIRQRCLC